MLIRVLAITLAEQTITNAMRPMVTYRALAVGATPLEVGLIVAAFAVLSLIGGLLGGAWTDRWSERWASVAGAVVMTGGCLVAVFAGNVPLLAASQAAVGLGQALVIVGSQSLLAKRGTGSDHGFGRYAAAASVGQLIGPLLGTVVATRLAAVLLAGDGSPTALASRLVFAGTVAMSLAVGVIAMRLPRTGDTRAADPGAGAGAAGVREAGVREAGARGERRRPRILPMLRSAVTAPVMRRAVLVSMVLTSSLEILVAYLPAYGEERGWSVEFVGVLLAVRALASIGARLFTGALLTRLGRLRLLTASMLLPAAALTAVGLLGSPAAALALVAVTGFWLGLGAPVTMHWVGQLSPPGVQATAIGVRLAGNRLGQSGMPLVAGALGGLLGIGAVFWTLGGCLAATAATLQLARPQRPPPDHDTEEDDP